MQWNRCSYIAGVCVYMLYSLFWKFNDYLVLTVRHWFKVFTCIFNHHNNPVRQAYDIITSL